MLKRALPPASPPVARTATSSAAAQVSGSPVAALSDSTEKGEQRALAAQRARPSLPVDRQEKLNIALI